MKSLRPVLYFFLVGLALQQPAGAEPRTRKHPPAGRILREGPTVPIVKVWDGTNIQAVKPGSTAAQASDPAAVVAVSPATPLPAGTNTLGAVNQGTAGALGGAWPVKHTDGTNTAPTMDAVGRAGYQQITDGVTVLGTAAHPLRVDPTGTTPQTVTPATASTSAISQVAASATSTQCLAANSNRLGAAFTNDATGTLYLKLGTTASLASYTVQLASQAYYELPARYVGRVDCIWTTAGGYAYVTELTP
jgi:hypothetical protein